MAEPITKEPQTPAEEPGGKMQPRPRNVVGKPFRRVDGRAKVTGQTRFADDLAFHPAPFDAKLETQNPKLSQMFGSVWQWTQSAYLPYPGFRALPGALGEYNGKFMCGQFVLKGASCATPRGHSRASYRNFFPPNARWQFTGVRLARDA